LQALVQTGHVGPDHFAAVAGNMVDGRADNSAAFVATVKAGERSTAPQIALQDGELQHVRCKRYALRPIQSAFPLLPEAKCKL